MLRLVLVKIREALEGRREDVVGVAEAPGPWAVDLAPLPVAVRLNTSLRMRGREDLEISTLVWLSPEREGIPPRRLEAILNPN